MSADVTALQETLAGEHATIYGYGVAGARLPGAARREARAAYDTHRARRDRWRALIVAAGAQPVPAAAAYTLPFPVRTPADARRLAALLEQRLAVGYARLVAASTATERELAARSLQDAAVRALRWSGSSPAFPGLPDRAAPTPTPTS
jgi:uncharacterized protein DUF4439